MGKKIRIKNILNRETRTLSDISVSVGDIIEFEEIEEEIKCTEDSCSCGQCEFDEINKTLDELANEFMWVYRDVYNMGLDVVVPIKIEDVMKKCAKIAEQHNENINAQEYQDGFDAGQIGMVYLDKVLEVANKEVHIINMGEAKHLHCERILKAIENIEEKGN